MNRLQAELQRLYLAPDALLAPDGRTRALVLQVAGPGAWSELARAWQGVQADLQLPPPAIAVTGSDAFQLWFSLDQPVAPAQASAFLETLRARYLAQVPPSRVALRPSEMAGQVQHVPRIPPFEHAAERWSAFLAADLAGLFADDPCLDLPPTPDAQAELLSRLRVMKLAEFRAALEHLQAAPERPAGPPQAAPSARPARAPAAHDDPRRFLLDVMNDPAVDLHLRIEAAKALLPSSGTRGNG